MERFTVPPGGLLTALEALYCEARILPSEPQRVEPDDPAGFAALRRRRMRLADNEALGAGEQFDQR